MFFSLLSNVKVNAQAEPFIGQLALVPYNFAPRGWALCNGQILSIAQNTALFSLLGTTYGGNGTTTFALPDLRGRVAVSSGQGPGLSSYELGQVAGEERHTLITTEMPMHNHLVNATTVEGNQNTPTGNFPADTKLLDKEYSNSTSTGGTVMNPQMIGFAGGNQSHNIMQPYLTLNYIIALEGIYPSRN